MYPFFRKIATALFSGCLALSQAAYAQTTYPDKPIKIVVPYTAGASTDTLARIIGESVSKQLKQPVIIENKPGAAGIIASNYVKQQKPDGYTLMLTTDGIASVNPSLYKSVSYDPVQDFTSLTMAVSVSNALVVRNDSEFKTVGDVVDYAKKNPEKLSYGSAGVGSSLHIAGELLNDTEGIHILHVPYKGGAAEMNALLGGEVSMIYVPMVSALNFQSAGKARILGIGSKQRNPAVPEVPTFKEQGVDYDSDTWYGFAAPAGVDSAVVQVLHQAIKTALVDNKSRLEAMGFTVTASSPEEMDDTISAGLERWKPLLQKIDLYQKM
ncbi:Bug family tripartite tricarboxylate transporter substrate binding protein [Advenella mimigardefordensis]|uniref:Putative Bug-like extracytoplasmic solute binding receptor, TTT family n=1 Tax=Advenella mimigardefordensis (strain DSM 17166 / LMG 22922 / DPN7) TaxID=1247726 RepID=W0P701_ADVMD|nr:tripartite tricarboxylate transporter substrate binding protein [Advenella mimigardefordensis]AHG62536.1 putative Bug-like extracytoplasmic solute binding receptor, TTT family [Advenella mimigardefordensis DPN7]